MHFGNVLPFHRSKWPPKPMLTAALVAVLSSGCTTHGVTGPDMLAYVGCRFTAESSSASPIALGSPCMRQCVLHNIEPNCNSIVEVEHLVRFYKSTTEIQTPAACEVWLDKIVQNIKTEIVKDEVPCIQY